MSVEDKQYLISIDGGGTKTEFCIVNRTKKWQFVFASTNYKSVGFEKAQGTLTAAFQVICSELSIEQEEITGTVAGISGCDTEKDYEIYKRMFLASGFDLDHTYLCNDCELAYFSLADAPGICVVAGTGSIALGFGKNKKTTRCGGWGCPLSDEGSGYWISSQVLRQLIRYCDNRVGFQPVFDKIKEFYKADTYDALPEYLTELENSKVASAAGLIIHEAEQGDEFCNKIMQQAVSHISEIAYVVYRNLDFEGEEMISVVTTGSIFNSRQFSDGFREELSKKLKKKNVIFLTMSKSPADCAISLAKKKFNVTF